MSTSLRPALGTNQCLLIGTLSRDPEPRALPSGDQILTLEVTVRPAGGRAESVPVVLVNPPATALAWLAGLDLLVVGRVRRRFFRAGGATQSRTEVIATAAVPLRRAGAVRKALRELADDVSTLAG